MGQWCIHNTYSISTDTSGDLVGETYKNARCLEETL